MGKKILLAEDEKDVAMVTATPLIKMGYDVIIAANGEEALNRIRVSQPDLILLDYLMPRLDGREVCRRIKGDARLKNIPIIVLTASQTENLSQLLEEAQVDDYLVKPYQIEDLIKKIKRILG
jgi:two-component system phosphate regulon response regulator PhoB